MPVTGYFFVMDGRRFEAQAILLATSLHKQMPEAPVIAYVPEASKNTISRVTHMILRATGTEIRHFDPSTTPWASRYPHGNKILAACEPREGWDVSVFLDTDTLCIAPMDFSECAGTPTLAAVPEGVPTWGRDHEDWRAAYGIFDLPLPAERVALERGRRREMPPYFNAGLVAFTEAPDAEGRRLPDFWLDTALTLDHAETIKNKRPWLDQISLPIAMARAGAQMAVKPSGYNFSLYRRDPQIAYDPIHLAHYHIPGVFRDWAECRATLPDTYALLPPKMHQKLRNRLGTFQKDLSAEGEPLQPEGDHAQAAE